MSAGVIGSAIVVALIVGVLVPAVAWLDGRQRRLATAPPTDPEAESPGSAFERLIAPIVDTAGWLSGGDPRPAGAAPLASRLAPAVSWLAAWMLLAVVPFGGRYAILREPVTLGVADPAWGLAMVVLAPALAVLGNALAGVAGVRSESLIGGVRAATQGGAALLALLAALLPMIVLYGSLQPTAVGAWQDGVISFDHLLGLAGIASPAWLPAGAGLPAWGGILNPPAFVLFVVAAMILVGGPPFDAPFARALSGGVGAELAGARRVVFRAAGYIWTLAFACITVLLFVGGWSLPWITQTTLVGWIAPHLGSGFAEAVCALLHVASFLAKVAVVLWAMLWLRWSLPGLRSDQVRALCLRRLVPIGLADAFMTAAVVGAVGGAVS